MSQHDTAYGLRGEIGVVDLKRRAYGERDVREINIGGCRFLVEVDSAVVV